MKNTLNFKTILRIVGIVAFVAVIGFSMTACDNGGEGSNLIDYTSLNGIWSTTSSSGMTRTITINGNSGIYTNITNPTSNYQEAISSGLIKLGSTKCLQKLTSTGNLTWFGQTLILVTTITTTTTQSTRYDYCNITMSADGKTFTIDSGGSTWKRQ